MTLALCAENCCSSANCCRTVVVASAAAVDYAMTVGTTVDTVRTITINQTVNGLNMDPIIWEGRARLPDGVLPEPPDDLRTLGAGLFVREFQEEADEENSHEAALLTAAGNVYGRSVSIEDSTRDIRDYGRCGRGLRLAAISVMALAVLALSAYGSYRIVS